MGVLRLSGTSAESESLHRGSHGLDGYWKRAKRKAPKQSLET